MRKKSEIFFFVIFYLTKEKERTLRFNFVTDEG
jgi:hypothetical protein